MLSGGSEERLGAIGTVSIFPSEHEAPDGATNWVFCAHMTDNKPWISPSIRGCQAYLQIPNEVELYLHYGSLDHFIPIISIIFPLYPHLHMDHFQIHGCAGDDRSSEALPSRVAVANGPPACRHGADSRGSMFFQWGTSWNQFITIYIVSQPYSGFTWALDHGNNDWTKLYIYIYIYKYVYKVGIEFWEMAV